MDPAIQAAAEAAFEAEVERRIAARDAGARPAAVAAAAPAAPNFRVKIRKLGEHWKTTLSPTEARPTITQKEAEEHADSHMAAGYEALVEEVH